jgi:hypothetical protein
VRLLFVEPMFAHGSDRQPLSSPQIMRCTTFDAPASGGSVRPADTPRATSARGCTPRHRMSVSRVATIVVATFRRASAAPVPR